LQFESSNLNISADSKFANFSVALKWLEAGAQLGFCRWSGPDFGRGGLGTEVPQQGPGTLPGGSLGARPQKADFAHFAVHTQVLTFPVCVLHYKRK